MLPPNYVARKGLIGWSISLTKLRVWGAGPEEVDKSHDILRYVLHAACVICIQKKSIKIRRQSVWETKNRSCLISVENTEKMCGRRNWKYAIVPYICENSNHSERNMKYWLSHILAIVILRNLTYAMAASTAVLSWRAILKQITRKWQQYEMSFQMKAVKL